MGRHHPAAFALVALLIAGCGNSVGDDGPAPACPACAAKLYSCVSTTAVTNAYLTVTDHSATGCSGDLQGSPIVFDCEKQEVCLPDCRSFTFFPNTGGNTVNGLNIGDTITCHQHE